MIYTLKNTKTGLSYNYKRYNGNPQWTIYWWFAYKYQTIEKAQEHKAILEKHGIDLEIQKHSKSELKDIPDEKWKIKEPQNIKDHG